jgi:hypothetical protein
MQRHKFSNEYQRCVWWHIQIILLCQSLRLGKFNENHGTAQNIPMNLLNKILLAITFFISCLYLG